MSAVYMTMHPQEELADLFSRNLTFNPMAQPAPAPAPAPELRKIVYISQHYNHSAHIARHEAQEPQRPVSEPTQGEHEAVQRVLREHGVNPSPLTSAQLNLFSSVDTPQQLHLIELWRVCPPRNNNPAAWQTTSVDQETALAQQRYEEQQQEQELIDQQLHLEMDMDYQQQHHHNPHPSSPPETVMSLDGTPLTPIQAGDGRWLVADSASFHDVEPYMAAGYEDMTRREYEDSVRHAFYAEVEPKQATDMFGRAAPAASSAGGMQTFSGATARHADPVYKTTNNGADVRYASIENQYGAFMAGRVDEEML
ncbi:hypothetical protein N0V88_004349 [Collariella sp. IMI 366227]|nr:hypothetical protein N0V88_004349 [Collariella sp. IMI 366227]